MSESITDLYLLHAGAVSKNGVGIIFPGASGSGKSSLTLALTLQDYSYLSDELAVIDPKVNLLRAFPKPFSVKDATLISNFQAPKNIWFGPVNSGLGDSEEIWYAHPEDVSPKPISNAVPVKYIIFPTYDSDSAPHLKSLKPDETMRRLIENSVNHHKFGKNWLHVLGALVENAQSYSLVSNDLEATTALISELTES